MQEEMERWRSMTQQQHPPITSVNFVAKKPKKVRASVQSYESIGTSKSTALKKSIERQPELLFRNESYNQQKEQLQRHLFLQRQARTLQLHPPTPSSTSSNAHPTPSSNVSRKSIQHVKPVDALEIRKVQPVCADRAMSTVEEDDDNVSVIGLMDRFDSVKNKLSSLPFVSQANYQRSHCPATPHPNMSNTNHTNRFFMPDVCVTSQQKYDSLKKLRNFITSSPSHIEELPVRTGKGAERLVGVGFDGSGRTSPFRS